MKCLDVLLWAMFLGVVAWGIWCGWRIIDDGHRTHQMFFTGQLVAGIAASVLGLVLVIRLDPDIHDEN